MTSRLFWTRSDDTPQVSTQHLRWTRSDDNNLAVLTRTDSHIYGLNPCLNNATLRIPLFSKFTCSPNAIANSFILQIPVFSKSLDLFVSLPLPPHTKTSSL